MDIIEFQQSLFERGKQYGFSDMESFYSSNKSTSVNVMDKVVKDYKIAETCGLSFRGIVHEKMGYSYAEKISMESIDFLLKEALENAEIIEIDDEEQLFAGAEKYETVNQYSEELAGVPVEKLIESAFEMEEAALAEDQRIKQVLQCSISKNIYEVAIVNTKGLKCHSKGCSANAGIYVMASDTEQTSTGFHFDYTLNDYSKMNFQNIAKKAVAEAVSKLGAESMESGNYPVILRYDTATELFGTFISSFSAENVEKGLSRLEGKLGEKICGSNIYVIEDPLMEGAPGAEGFDAEGYPAQKIVLVEQGKLNSFMHNRKTARKAGTQSTGNASKNSYRSTVTVGPHNVYLKPGEKSLDEMIKLTQNGIYIIELQGTNAGINNVSGDFSLYATGFFIENGRCTRPINQITISGNIFDMLNHIEEIGNDLIINSSIAAPSIKVNELSISGK